MKPFAILCSVVIFLISPTFIYAQSKSTPKKKPAPTEVQAPAAAPDPAQARKSTIDDLRNFKNTVKVSIAFDDSIARDEISSYLKRELRSFKDVDVVDSDPSYEINIVGMTTRSRGGQETGYALAVCFLSHISYAWLMMYAKPEFVDMIKEIPGHRQYLMSVVSVGAKSDLHNMCKRIIASFDTDVLEEGRQLRQKYINYLEKDH